MALFKNLLSIIFLLGLTTQPIQSFGPFTLSGRTKKTLVGGGIVFGAMYANHIYKRFIEPKYRSIPNLVSPETKNGPQILGDAIAKAVAENPFFNEENPFYWGVSSACSQNESESRNSTVSTEYIEREDIKERRQGKIWQPLGDACLSNEKSGWEDDNKKVQNLGCKMYRFSVDWSRVEPEDGKFDAVVLQRYADQCADLIARGITPMICFHHYADPIWFMDNGGFEDSKNAQKFVRFAKEVINKLATVNVKYWLIMNQPLAYINKGYVVGMHAPFKKGLISNNADIVRQNIFELHKELLEFFKFLNTEKETINKYKVGISHQITPMKANRYWSIIDPLIAFVADKTYNQRFLNFAAENKDNFDFFALSFYSPGRFKIANMHSFWDSERIGNETDDAKRIIDAQGFYDAIVRVANAIGREKPIIFIETGLDTDESKDVGTKRRKNYFNKTISALARAIRDGYHVKAFCVWTLMDNYEWGEGYNAHFGLYNRRTSEENLGTLKDGGQYYKDIIKHYNNSIST